MLKAALDVYYYPTVAKAVCVLFKDWASPAVCAIHPVRVQPVAAYEPGAFYKRELPCLLQVLQKVELSAIDVLVIDGYVYVNNGWGLGAHLYAALHKRWPVIGVAKTRFHGNGQNVVEVFRGTGRRPLYVSAAGMDVNRAAAHIRSMAGPFRRPWLLQYLDAKTREPGGE